MREPLDSAIGLEADGSVSEGRFIGSSPGVVGSSDSIVDVESIESLTPRGVVDLTGLGCSFRPRLLSPFVAGAALANGTPDDGPAAAVLDDPAELTLDEALLGRPSSGRVAALVAGNGACAVEDDALGCRDTEGDTPRRGVVVPLDEDDRRGIPGMGPVASEPEPDPDPNSHELGPAASSGWFGGVMYPRRAAKSFTGEGIGEVGSAYGILTIVLIRKKGIVMWAQSICCQRP